MDLSSNMILVLIISMTSFSFFFKFSISFKEILQIKVFEWKLSPIKFHRKCTSKKIKLIQRLL